MKITVDVEESQICNLVKTRIAELFSTDARYRESRVRELINKIVDETAVSAVRQARDTIAGELPKLASEAVSRAIKLDMDKAATRGMGALRKLYAGFDPSKLTPEQRAWLEKQLATAADKREEK